MSPNENSTNLPHDQQQTLHLDIAHYILITISALSILIALLFSILWCIKYRSLNKTIQELRQLKPVMVPSQDSPPLSPTSPQSLLVMPELSSSAESHVQIQKSRPSTRLLCRPSQKNLRISKADLKLIQLIKAGREGAFYKARMMRGTCKGHLLIICKIAKEGITPKQIETEVSIMRKLVYHKNVLQLLDWNTAEEPFMLIMEFVSHGTLRSFVQTHHDKLRADPEIQNLFTIASYHIALAMEHLRSKMVSGPVDAGSKELHSKFFIFLLKWLILSCQVAQSKVVLRTDKVPKPSV